MEIEEKKVYVSPKIKGLMIQMESCLASGSVEPTSQTKEVTQEWQSDPDKEGSMSW